MDSIICWALCIIFYSTGQVNAQVCMRDPGREVLRFAVVDTNQNISVETKDFGSMSPLFRMSNLLLDTVQTKPFPEDLLRAAFNNRSSLQTSSVIKYEAGYVVCAAIAVLFIIFMLVLGIIFCIYQRKGRRIFSNCDGALCQCSPIFMSLIVTCCILFAGLVCSFYLNEKVQREVSPGTQDIKQSLQDFRNSLNSIPEALKTVMNEFSVPKRKVFDELQNFVPLAESIVVSKLNKDINPILSDAIETSKQIETATKQLVNVNKTMMNLQQRQVTMLVELNNHRENLFNVLSDTTCTNCSEAANTVRNLELGLIYSKIPSMSEYMNSLRNAMKVNLTAMLMQGFRAFGEATTIVNTQATRSVQETMASVEMTEKRIRNQVDMLSIQNYITPINKALLSFEDECDRYGQEVERYEYYRWVVAIVLCSVVLVIFTCTVLGLSLGVFGLYARQNPSAAAARRRTGSVFLKVEVYLSFLFSWLLIIFVFIIFLVGGNVQTLLCKHWANGDIYRFLDNPKNLPQNLNLKALIGLKENSNLSDLYQQCSRGAPIWDVVQFDAVPELDKTFNMSTYTGDLESKIDSIAMETDGIDLFTGLLRMLFSDIKSSGLDKVPTSSIMAQLQVPLLTQDSVKLVAALEALNSIQSDPNIQSQLKNEIDSFKIFQSSTLRDQETNTVKLNNSLQSLGELTPNLQTDIDRAIQNIENLHGPVMTDLMASLKHQSKCLFNQSIGYFDQYLHWVKKTVVEDIASCRAAPLTLDRVRVIICHNVTQPWNGFWFCLAWCTFFLIPNVLFSIKSSELIEPKSLGPQPTEENSYLMREIPTS